MTGLKKRTLKAMVWDITGSLASKGTGFIVSIFLARILTPEDFGLVGMVMVLVALSAVLLDVGLGSALIQRKDLQDIDYSSVLIVNACLGLFLSVLMYYCSDLIGQFYDNQQVPQISRAMCWMFVINSLGIVPKNKLVKELKFKKLTQVSFVSSVISGIVGVLMALTGFGLWSLVVQMLTSITLNVALLWFSVFWFPGVGFSLNRLKSLWGFGLNIFITSLLNTTLVKLDILLIGKLFTPALLGYYSRAQSVTKLVNNYSGQGAMRVLFPAFSEIQDDKVKLESVYQKGLIFISFASFSLIGLLYLTAESWFILIFSSKWSASVPFLKIMILRSFVMPLSALSVCLLKAVGKSRECLHAEVLKKTLLLIAVVVGFSFGIMEFLYAILIQGIIALCINFYYVGRTINVNIPKHLKTIWPFAVNSLITTTLIIMLKEHLQISIAADLLLSLILFGVILFGILKLTRNRILLLIRSELKPLFS